MHQNNFISDTFLPVLPFPLMKDDESPNASLFQIKKSAEMIHW